MTRKSISSTFRLSTLAAGLAVAASSFAAHAAALNTSAVATQVYAGGEAMAPEAEARMNALMTTPGGAWSRADARQDLASAQQSGTVSAAGEIADTPQVLVARADFNQRQTRQILAAHEAERQRVAAIEAERVAVVAAEAERQRLATLPVESGSESILASSAVAAEAAPGETLITEPAEAQVLTAPLSEPPLEEAPTQAPIKLPAALPIEVPISRAEELPSDMIVDTE